MTIAKTAPARLEFERLTGTVTPEHFTLNDDGDYRTVLEHIRTHKYLTNERLPWVISDREAFHSWHETVYRPLADAIAEFNLTKAFPALTDGEIFLKVSDHKFYLEQQKGRPVGADDAVISFAARHAPSTFTRCLYSLGLQA